MLITGISATFIIKTPGNHRLGVDRSEDNRIGPADSNVLNLAHLLRNAVRPGRHVLHNVGIHPCCPSFGTHTYGLKERIDLIFRENSEGFVSFRSRTIRTFIESIRSARTQNSSQEDCDRQLSGPCVFHGFLLFLFD